MLTKLTVRNFKSLMDVTVEFRRLAVLLGPNAAGKSNLLDAIAALSGIGNVRTLSDVLDRPLPVRGHAFEAFSFPGHRRLSGWTRKAPRAPQAQAGPSARGTGRHEPRDTVRSESCG